MSRFFASVNDSSSESDSSEENEIKDTIRRRVVFSSDDEDDRRVVKSTTSKIIDESKALALIINNLKKINDFTGLLARFEELCKIYTKYQSEFKDGKAPTTFIACLSDLCEYVVNAWDDVDARKGLAKTGFKSLTSLRQKIRKFCKNFEAEISEYLKNPRQLGNDEDCYEEDRLRSLSPVWDNTSDSSSDSDEDTAFSSLREKFLKKTNEKDAKQDKRGRKVKVVKSEENADAAEWQTVRRGQTEQTKSEEILLVDSDITVQVIVKNLAELVNRRGVKRSLLLKQLIDIYEIAADKDLGAGILVKILKCHIYALFDYNMANHDCMKDDYWSMLLKCLKKMGDLILSNDFEINNDAFIDDLVEEPPYKVHLSVAAIVERMLDEHVKILKATDVLTPDYWSKLADDSKMLDIIDVFQQYIDKTSQIEDQCRMKMCKIQLLYYKFNKQAAIGEDEEPFQTLDKLCKFIYANDRTSRLRTHAILAQIYHLAVNNRWHTARDLMLMSHLQSSIEYANIETQILFNRTMAQLGMCAFRMGHIEDAYDALTQLMRNHIKWRQLLGQGTSFRRQLTREEEAREKMHQVPDHMKIQTELLSCSFMISAMLLEIPQVLGRDGETGMRKFSRSFSYIMRYSDRKQQGPPETHTQFVADACKALFSGNFQQCRDLLFNPTMDCKIWKHVEMPVNVKEIIIPLLQKHSLQIFVKFTALQVYDSLSLEALAEKFEMTEAATHAVLSSLIVNEELPASINLPGNILIFHPGSSKKTLHGLTNNITDSFLQHMDTSERLIGLEDRAFYRKHVAPRVF